MAWERAYLQSLGWQIAPIYVGQQDPDYDGGDLSYSPSSQQGTNDGNEAVAEMGPPTGTTEIVYDYDTTTTEYDIPKTVAQGQGFSSGTVVYLDLEYGELSTSPNVAEDEAYIVAWCQTVSAHGYTPGVYCPYTDGATVHQMLQQAGINAVVWAADPDYGVSAGLDNLPTPDPSGSGYSGATSWQYADGYTIQTVNGPFDVDLDSSSQYSNSNSGGGSSAPVISNAKLTGSTFTLSVPTQTGTNYVLEYKNSMSDANWIPIQTNSGTGGMMNLTNTGTVGPSRFYRIRVQ